MLNSPLTWLKILCIGKTSTQNPILHYSCTYFSYIIRVIIHHNTVVSGTWKSLVLAQVGEIPLLCLHFVLLFFRIMVVKKAFDVAMSTTKLSLSTAHNRLSVLFCVWSKWCLFICVKLFVTQVSRAVKSQMLQLYSSFLKAGWRGAKWGICLKIRENQTLRIPFYV